MYLYSKDYDTDVLISSSGTKTSDPYDACLYAVKIMQEDPFLRYKKQILNNAYGYRPSEHIFKVIFNDPATIVFWADGTKTVVKCGERDTFDPEKGLAMAIAKHFLGDKGNYYNTFRKWLPKETQTDKSEAKNKAIGKVISRTITDDGIRFTVKLNEASASHE